MKRKINENVDAIFENLFGHLLIRDSGNVSPSVGKLLKLMGMCIGKENVGIADYFATGAIVPLEERQEVVAYNVISQIRRDVSDSQASIGIRCVDVTCREFCEWLGMLIVPEMVLLSERRSVVI